jgi:large subunit ribosomal protein L31
MNKNIQPELHDITAHCACGFSFQTSSTNDEIRTTICSHCHPFFTGAQKFLDTAGRIEKFEARYKKFQAGAQKSVEAPAKKKASKAKAK